VERLIPSVLAIACMERFSARIRRAVESLSALITVGRPPNRLRARAAARPARVRSRMISRSLCRAVGYAARDLELLANWADRDFALGIIAAV